MGKIDKEKLLKELPCTRFGTCINSKCKNNTTREYMSVSRCIGEVIKNFPEEPAIDFDALWNEFNGKDKVCHDCRFCKLDGRSSNKLLCFLTWLKSKNLTQQKPREIPVKKCWTLKKEYADYDKAVESRHSKLADPEQYPEFYDLKEEPDYSQIPKDSIVELKCGNNGGKSYYRKIVEVTPDHIKTTDGEWSLSSFIRVVEWAKEV